MSFWTVFQIIATIISVGSGIKSYQQAKKLERKGQDILIQKYGTGDNIPVVYGTRDVAGTVLLAETINNKELFVVYALCVGEVQSVSDFKISGRSINDTSVYREGYELRYSSYYGHTQAEINAILGGSPPRMIFNVHKGGTDNNTADPMLVGCVPGWTSAHKLKGITYLACHFEYDTKGMFNGLPEVTCTVQGKKLYDPRLDGTIPGGTGSHRQNDPSTWTFSDNPPLALLDYLSNSEYGKGIDYSKIALPTFQDSADDVTTAQTLTHTAKVVRITQATNEVRFDRNDIGSIVTFNKLKIGNVVTITSGSTTYASGRIVGKTDNTRRDIYDDGFRKANNEFFVYDPHLTITLASGSITTEIAQGSTTTTITATELQKRFEINGVIDTNESVLDNVKSMSANMRGIFTYSGGLFSLKIEGAESVALSIDEDDILDNGITLQLENKGEKYNKVEVEFSNAQKNYETDTVVYTHTATTDASDYTSDDGYESLEANINFPYITNQAIATQHAKAILERSRNSRSISFRGTHKLLNVKVGELISVTNPSLNMSSEQYRITQMEINSDLTISVTAIIYQSAVYGYVTPLGEDIDIPGDPVDPFRVDPPSSLNFVSKNTSNGKQPHLTWNNSASYPADEFRVILKDSNSAVLFDGKTRNNSYNLTGILVANGYVAEVSSINSTGVESVSETYNFNNATPPIDTPDLNDGSVTNDKIDTLSAGKINTGQLNLGTASGMAVRQAKTGYTSTATGFWLGNDGGTPKFNIGTSSNYFKFDGSSVTISGNISATTGTIGGFTVGETSLTAGTGTSSISLSTANGIHLGNNTFANAPFKVDLAGALTASNATIDGDITATTLDVVEANIQNLTLTLGGGILQDGSGSNLTVSNVINPNFPVDGLLHYFPLNGFSDPNDTTPADVIDVVSDVTGVITGSNASFDTDSPNGQSYVNGATTGITLLSNAQAETWQTTTGDYTVALWFKSTTESGSGASRIIGRDASDKWSLALDQDETGNQKITLFTDANATTWDGASVNEWHHIALVANGTTSAKLYIDGVLRITDTGIDYLTDPRPVVLGCNTESSINTASNVFLGKFSDVRFYTKAITDKQVQSLYMNPAGGLPAKIEGDLFVSNSITADKLIVNSLDSLSANLGSITAGQINIGSGKFTVSSAGVMTAREATIEGAFSAGSGTNIFKADTNGIYTGNSSFASAPFKVNASGSVQTTNSFTAGVTGTSNIAIMSGSDATYRFWSGNQSPTSANFSVDKTGKVVAQNLVLKLLDGTVFFDSSTGFTSSALSQISTTTGTKVSTISSTFDADAEYESVTVTDQTTVNVSVSLNSLFGGSGSSDQDEATAEANSEAEIPDNFTLTIEHSSDGGSSYTNPPLVSQEFEKVNTGTPSATQYKITTNTDIMYISGQGGIAFLSNSSVDIGSGCVDASGNTVLTYTGLVLTVSGASTTHRIKATVSTSDSSYDTINKVTSTAPRVLATTDPSGTGFYVADGDGTQVAPSGDITRVQITTDSSSGLTGGTNFLSGDALFTLGLASTIPGNKTFSDSVVIQGNLDIQGTTTTIDSVNLDVKDKNITLNYGTGDTSANANGAGITIQDAVSAGNDATLTWATTSDRFNFSHGLDFPDSALLILGSDDDFRLQHTGSVANISNYTGNIDIKNFADDSDISLLSDNGSGGLTTYFRADGSNGQAQLFFYGAEKLNTTTDGIDVSGNIAVSGTVDGRDIATDGTKLDGIETGATADQTQAQINALGITATGLSGTPNITVGAIANSSITASNLIKTTSHVQSGENSGGVALTINDGYGNANITWNHLSGVPEQDGNSARIEVNTDSTSNATMYFELKSGVTSGTAVQADSIMELNDNGLFMYTGKYIHGAGGVTINADDNDFVVEDNTDAVTNFIWRDFSSSKLYLGTDTAVVTLRSNLDALDKIISAGNLGELQIFNDGSNSVIRSSDDLLIQRNTSPRSAIKVTDSTGKVELYYAGSAVLETTSTGISVTDTINFTDPTAFIRNSQDASGQIIISALNSSSSAQAVRWDVANNTNGAWRPEVTAISNLGLTNRVWNDLYINQIKIGASNNTFVDISRNVTANTISIGGSEIINSSGVYLNTISSSQVTTALGYTPYQESTALSATTGAFTSTVNIDGVLQLDRGSIADTALEFLDNVGNYSIRHNVNDGNGNYSISIGYDGGGEGRYAVTGDGVAKILMNGHGREGSISLNSAPTGTAGNDISFSMGLVVDQDRIAVGASSDGTGLDANEGIKVFDASANAFATSYSIGTSTVIDASSNLTNIGTISSTGQANFNGNVGIAKLNPVSELNVDGRLVLDKGTRSNPTGVNSALVIDYRDTGSEELARIRSRDWDGNAWKDLRLEALTVRIDTDGVPALTLDAVRTATFGGAITTGSEYQNYVIDGTANAHQYLDTRDYMVSKGHHAGAKYIVGGHSAQIHLVVPYINGTDVFVDGVLKIPNAQADGTVYQLLASELSAFSEITADKPISVMATNPSAPTMNTNYSGRVLGLFVDRYQPIDIYVYSPFAKVTVEFYKKSTAPVDASSSSSGDFVYTTTIDAGSGFIFQEDVHGGGSSSGYQYFIVKADGLICAESMPQGGGDYTLLSPASMELLGSEAFSPNSFGYTESSVTSSITVSSNGSGTAVASYYRDNSGKNGIFAYGTADGAGGDAEFAVPIEYLSDYYIYNEADLTNFRLVSYKTNTIKVLDKQNNVLYTYDHRSATKSAPMYSSEGADSGSGAVLSTNGAFKFIGTAPFHLVCQNEADDEMVQLGAMQRELYTSKNIDFKSTVGSPVGDISPFDATANTLTFLTSVAHQHGIITGATLGVVDLSTGELEITQQGVITIKSDSITADVIVAGTITATEIASDTITADKINVTDLALDFTANTVSGSAIGSWQSNQMRLKKVADLGTEPGIYHIYCRVFGSNGQVKTLSIVAGDGTFGGFGNELRNDFSYQDGSAPTIVTQDIGYAQYHSGQTQYWSAIDRFDSSYEMVQKDFIVRKTSSTSRTLALYILAQGDGSNRQLSNVQYGFYKFSEI